MPHQKGWLSPGGGSNGHRVTDVPAVDSVAQWSLVQNKSNCFYEKTFQGPHKQHAEYQARSIMAAPLKRLKGFLLGCCRMAPAVYKRFMITILYHL